MFFSYGADSQVRMGAIDVPLLALRLLAKVVTVNFARPYFSQRDLYGVQSPFSHGCVVQEMRAQTLLTRVLFLSTTSGIVLNPSACTISDHSRSVKDIDPYQLCG